MKTKILISLLILLSVGCQSYRAERKIKKLKSWGYLSDSVITKYDTLRGYEIDTFVQFDSIHHTDTLFTYQNGLKVTTIVRWRERQVKQIISQKDTIFEHRISTKVIKDKGKWYNTWLIGCICGLLTCIILIIILRYVLVTLGKNTDINTH